MSKKQKLYIIKIGGKIVDDPIALENVLQQFKSIEGYKILVHGGGKLATELSEKMNVPVNMIDGRRITDEKTLDIALMAYAGLVNKKIVAQLQGMDCNALGLTGADANTIQAIKRPVKEIDYGLVGDIEAVNISSISRFLENGIFPVFAALTHDGKGQMLNTNADTIASALARFLSAVFDVTLIYCFEKLGVLTDIDNENSLIEEIKKQDYESLKSKNIIAEGMIPKLDNSFDAINKGVSAVKICKGSNLLSCIENKKYTGTTLLG